MKKKVISIVLSLIMTVQFVVPAYAEGITEPITIGGETTLEETIVEDTLEDEETAVSDELPYVLEEEESLREENAKTFLLSNGEYLVAMYPSAVHQQDENGEWVQIDNSLEEAEALTENNELSVFHTSNANKSLDVTFAASLEGRRIFALSNDDHVVSVSLIDADKARTTPKKSTGTISSGAVAGTIGSTSSAELNATTNTTTLAQAHPGLVANETREQPATINIVSQDVTTDTETEADSDKLPNSDIIQNPEALLVENVYQKVLYEDVYENVDLEYIASGKTVKENIIVNEPLDSYDFAFELDINDLNYVVNEDKSIFLNDDEGNTEFVIQSPVMYDANGLASNDVTYEIIENAGQHYLIVSADEDWVNAAEFPVTIDPTVTDKIDVNNSLESAHVTETNHYNNVALIGVGRLPNEDKRMRGYIKFDVPTIPNGSIVSRAYLSFGIVEIYDYNGNDPRLYTTAYMCPSSWNSETIKWSTQPGTPNRNPKEYMDIIESHEVYAGDKGAYIPFDVTKAVSEWIQEPSKNHGLVFADGFEEDAIDHYTTLSTSLYENYPMLTMTYRVAKGLESYWETYSASISDAGTAHVNLYSGDLTLEMPIFSDTAQRMPLSYSLVYNSVDLGTNITDNYHGRGWRSNIMQRVTSVSVGDAKYKYVDADGTPHYFVLQDNKYIDEDGLGLTLTESDTQFVIKDQNRTEYTFNKSYYGYLSKIKDTNSNQMTIVHSDTGTVITTSGTRQSTVTKNTSLFVKSFTNSIGQTTTFTHSSNFDDGKSRLTKITYPDGTYTTFTYTEVKENEYVINTITGPNGHQLDFNWDKYFRVTSITERYGEYTGQTVKFSYAGHSTTTVRTSGKDDIISNSDDLLTHYLFDEWGRAATVYTTNTSKTKVYGVQNVGFTDAENGQDSNKLSKNVASGSNAINLLLNGSMEDGCDEYVVKNWSGSAEGTITPVTSSSVSYVYQGKRSAKLEVVKNDDTTNATGTVAARRYQELPAGKYTLSGYVKTSNVVASTMQGGAALGVTYKDTDGTQKYFYSQYMTGSSAMTYNIDDQSTVASDNATYVENNKKLNEDLQGGWRRLSVSFELKAKTTVYFGAVLRKATGEMWFDAMQLETGDVANPLNLVANAGFEDSDSGVAEPIGWFKGETANSADKVWVNMYSSAESDSHYKPMFGEKAYRIVGRVTHGTTYDTGLYQTIPVRGEAGDVYTVSGWINLWSPPDTNYYKPKHQIKVRIRYSNGNALTIGYAKANPYILGWQYVSESFVLKNEQTDGATITGIQIVLQYDNMPFYAAFDNISLTKDEGVTHTYDTEGKLISSAALKEQTANIEYYSETDLPKSYTNVDGNKTTYTYDENRNLLTTTSPSGLVTTINYNSSYSSVPIGQEITDGEYTIYTSQETRGAGNYLYSSTDSLGNESKIYYNVYDPDYTGNSDHIHPDPTKAYPYVSSANVTEVDGYLDPNPTNNRITGQVYLTKDARGKNTIYGYTNDDRLASVARGSMSVGYTYSNGRLASLTNDTAVYSFEYTTYGALKRIFAGDSLVLLNTYNTNNGKLIQTNQAGAKEHFTYNELEQLSQRYFEDGDTINYKYDGNGNLVQKEQEDGIVWDYYYDNAGTLIGTANSNGYLSKYRYDAAGRLNTEVHQAQTGYKRGTAYAYNKQGLVSDIRINGGAAIVTGAYTYNKFGFPSTKTFTRTDNSVYTSYLYRTSNVADKALSTQLHSVYFGTGSASEPKSDADQSYRYIYDEVGNITRVDIKNSSGNWDSSGILHYTYGNNLQITRVDDRLNNKTILYSYNNRGNLTRARYYAFTTGDVGTLLRTDTWTYGGRDNNELIESTINGVTTEYTYPYYGMPSNWTGGRAITWRNGTDMAAIGNVTFTYDDGQRVSKTADGVTTNYIYEGDKLIMMERNGTRLFFLYDQNGVLGFDYIKGSTKKTYYYRIDGKGEVIALTDSAGVVVANYNYDPWGKILSVTDASGAEITSATDVAKLNPFRYKSYVYDNETELYYLNSRYYDPQVCRFVSRDEFEYLGVEGGINLNSYNLFAYCYNNPVMEYDPSGNTPPMIALIVVASGITGAVLGAYSAYCSGGNMLNAAVVGGLTSAISAGIGLVAPYSKVAKAIIAGVSGLAVEYIAQTTTSEHIDFNIYTVLKPVLNAAFTGGSTLFSAIDSFDTVLIDALKTIGYWSYVSMEMSYINFIAQETLDTINHSSNVSHETKGSAFIRPQPRPAL